jgi:tRNA dimethylallyltransferase
MDSVQVYRGLDIGSAKVSMAQRAKVPHHLLDICSPDTRYTAAQFCLDTTAALTAIRQRGKIALIVGGTFLYLQAFVYGLTPMPDITEHARNQLAKLKTDGDSLWAFLNSVDAASATKISPADYMRIERALLVYFSSGQPMSILRTSARRPVHNYRGLHCVLLPLVRAEMKQVLAQRFMTMLSLGLVEEVKQCWEDYPGLTLAHPSMRAIGYRQVSGYIHGQFTYDQMCQAGIVATRRYFKRQLTWLRQMQGIDRVYHGVDAWNAFWDG